MIKKITCIECPKSCTLIVNIEDDKIISIGGYECPKGQDYARLEVENPLRILTSSVLTKNLKLKMIPVKTDKPIPKDKLFKGMNEIKKIIIDKPVKVGDIVIENFLGLKANLITTRQGDLIKI